MELIEILKAILYGAVEGITEWLPVSSTGHLILLEELIPLNVSRGFWDFFLVVVQLGAIIAVIVYFWQKLWPFNTRVRNKPFVRYDVLNLWVKIIVACIPAAVIGLLLDDLIDKYLYKWYVVAIMLIVVGAAFIFIENINRNKTPRVTSIRDLSIKDALLIGCFQVVAAVLPGTSRSGATITGGMLIGVDRPTSATFTFYLAIPVMAGASILKLVKSGLGFTGPEIAVMIVGTLVAFFVSLWCIRFLMDYVKRHDFKPFGWYRIALAALVLLYFGLIRK